MAMEGYLTSTEVADLLGIKPGSVYRARHRKAIPEPDDFLGVIPVWKRETIDEWRRTRPSGTWRRKPEATS